MNKGDSVTVINGVLEPDTELFEIGGWQGRIVDIDTVTTGDGTLLGIEWDSATLKLIPEDYIVQSEIEGLGWEMMVLFESDVVPSEPRDTEADVKHMQEVLLEKYFWSHLGEEGARIAAVLEGTDRNDEVACYNAWNTFMATHLTFPFQAEVIGSDEGAFVKTGTILTVNALSTVDEVDGILVAMTLNGEVSDFSLSDLDTVDKKSPNYEHLTDYGVWFANR